ncbi:MAG: carboxypeptidase M32 [Myxococcota bacterium]|nr:carboxypeptidase M32 [Myxococcota bacterium]
MVSYGNLSSQYHKIKQVGDAMGMLGWDQATMMPPGGADARTEQMTVLGAVRHELATDPRIEEWLNAAQSEDLDEWERANLREMKRVYRHETAVTADLVEALTRASMKCEFAWRTARKENDFATIQPLLEEVVSLTIHKAKMLGSALGKTPYDALLDQFEPDATSREIDGLFDQLTDFLPELLGKVIDRQAAQPTIIPLDGPFPVETQRALGLEVMKTIGFDFTHGRLDVSHHPFCGGTPTDIRITTRYAEDDFTQSLMGVIHETGHALYEAGLPRERLGQPVGESRSMGIHESQSLIMEMQACRSHEFIAYIAPRLVQAFKGTGPAWSPENIRRIYTKVQRGLIRVDADEVSYPLHVILRYRLETALLSGDLVVADLPDAWNEGMKNLIGIVPPNDTDGCLQDIHWMAGSFGYFPTYTLGAMNAAQLFESATAQDASILPSIGRGQFGPLLAWLRTNVHQRASRDSAKTLIENATGRPLEVDTFRRHLEARYLH